MHAIPYKTKIALVSALKSRHELLLTPAYLNCERSTTDILRSAARIRFRNVNRVPTADTSRSVL
jgi:hypothetical protein